MHKSFTFGFYSWGKKIRKGALENLGSKLLFVRHIPMYIC